MSKAVVPLRGLSIIVAVIVASVLAYSYQMNLPSLVYDPPNLASLLAFVTIPLLAGFILAIIYPEKAILDGLVVGLLSAIVNSIMATLKLLFRSGTPPIPGVYAFAFFSIISIFLWMILASVSTMLGRQVY